ncbi:MAG: hypothetical protein ACI9QD_000787 [Thermoproteota archaeon]|jgi:hypothetical protein
MDILFTNKRLSKVKGIGINLILICSLMMLGACVGEIENVEKDKTLTASYNPGGVIFSGIHSLYPISHTKLEVFFNPATGGSEKYNYRINYGNDSLTVPSEVLTPDYRGLLKYTLGGLAQAQDYIVSIDAIDQDSGGFIETERALTAKTFQNLVASFTGISQVSNLSGVDGLDSVKVRWAHAEKDFGDITGSSLSDPQAYEITIIDSDLLNPSDFDNSSLTQAQGRYFKAIEYDVAVNESVMRGLPSSSRFFARVRAIHNGSINDFNNPGLRSELNTDYLIIETLNADLSSLNFDTSSLVVTNTTGENAVNSMILSWDEVSGVFDHYRVYYSLSTTSMNASNITTGCSGNGFDVGGIYCKKVNYTLTTTSVANLIQATDYQFLLVVCQTVTCATGERIVSDLETGATIPTLASFSGIDSIQIASTAVDIGSMDLLVTPPNFDTGYFDGYIVGYKAVLTDTVFDKIGEDGYTGGLSLTSYDYTSENKVRVNGISYDGSTQYCFTVYPFIYDSLGGKLESPNGIWKCSVATIEAPTAEEYEGINQSVTDGNKITVIWNTPSSGVYAEYEVFWSNTGVAFNFSDAILDTTVNYTFTNYNRATVPGDQTSYLIEGLPDGTYVIGVLTRYVNGITAIERSEFNTQLFSCIVVDLSISAPCTALP